MKVTGKHRITLAALIMLAAMTIFSLTIFAADSVPSKATGYVDDEFWTPDMNLGGQGLKIANLKSNSSNLKAKVTRLSYDSYSESTATIGFYGKKKGTYKVTFDIVDKDGKKVSSKSIKVVVKQYSHKPYFKSVKVGKKTFKNASWISQIVTGKTEKVSWKVNTTYYTLKKVRVGKYKKVTKNGGVNTEIKWSDFSKKGGKITLSKVPYYYKAKTTGTPAGDQYYSNFTTSILAPTMIEFTFYDKSAKENITSTCIYLEKLVK